MYPSAVKVKHDAKIKCNASKNWKSVHKSPVRSIQTNLLGHERKTQHSFGELPRKEGTKNSENGILCFRHNLTWILNNQKPNHLWLQERNREWAWDKGQKQHSYFVKWQRFNWREDGLCSSAYLQKHRCQQAQLREATHLEIDRDYKSGSNSDSKRLVVWRCLSILSHSLQISSKWNEEEDQRC